MGLQKVCLVLSGGVALGAYQGGAYATLHARSHLWPERLAGSSIGSVNAAVIAGNPPEQRVERLRMFWEAVTSSRAAPLGVTQPWTAGPWRHFHNWASVLQTRLFGQPGAFQPRFPELMLRSVTSVYDLSPLRAILSDTIDFDRLNGGEIRLSVFTTDVETGQEVVFDTHKGDRIGPDHLLASCGFLPDFAPVEIDGRLLGDGGLAANAPFESVLLDESESSDLLCFVIDLFSAAGQRPTNLEEAAARRWDLMFGNQSRLRLENLEREYRVRWALGRLGTELSSVSPKQTDIADGLARRLDRTARILYLSYRAQPHEPGPEKPFDFSPGTVEDRWAAGLLDMEAALREVSDAAPDGGISVHRIGLKAISRG